MLRNSPADVMKGRSCWFGQGLSRCSQYVDGLCKHGASYGGHAILDGLGQAGSPISHAASMSGQNVGRHRSNLGSPRYFRPASARLTLLESSSSIIGEPNSSVPFGDRLVLLFLFLRGYSCINGSNKEGLATSRRRSFFMGNGSTRSNRWPEEVLIHRQS